MTRGRSDSSESKLLSLILRHQPSVVGLSLDAEGWVEVPTLLAALDRHGHQVDRARLERIVAEDSKGRYALDRQLDRIRANQGHSLPVDLGLEPTEPPALLFHGTPDRNLAAIAREGLHRGQRQHVHLSADRETAAVVGARRGEFTILTIDAAAMSRDGHPFFVSANGVWLTAAVPPGYVRV